jgi:hypothetical protein
MPRRKVVYYFEKSRTLSRFTFAVLRFTIADSRLPRFFAVSRLPAKAT